MPYTAAQVIAYLEKLKDECEDANNKFGTHTYCSDQLNVIEEMISYILDAEDEYAEMSESVCVDLWGQALTACEERAFADVTEPDFSTLNTDKLAL